MIDQSGCRCQRCACRIKRVWRRPHCWLTPGTVRDEMQGNGPLGPRPRRTLADHHTRHNPLGQDALFTTPASLMLDARLTPLERNGWQVLRMLRSAEGISPLANLGQLRRYLTSTPLGQRAGYETARRVLVVLRLTGWISLVGQHRDPLTGHVLSELYQVQESALHFQQACALDASLPALLQASIGHENNQVDRVAVHIQATLAQAPEAASMVAHDQRHDDDDLPLRRRRRRTRQPTHCHCLVIPLAARLFRNRPDTLAAWRLSRAVRIRRICIKERTYRAREGNGDSASQSVSLPPCLSNAQADQQRTCRPPCGGCRRSIARKYSTSCRHAAKAAPCAMSWPTSSPW